MFRVATIKRGGSLALHFTRAIRLSFSDLFPQPCRRPPRNSTVVLLLRAKTQMTGAGYRQPHFPACCRQASLLEDFWWLTQVQA